MKSKLIQVTNDTVDAAWLQADDVEFGLIARAQDGTNYVMLQIPGARCHIALYMRDGEPVLQVPCQEDVAHIVKISTILDNIELLEGKNSKKHQI